jgi:phosphate transport system substrate-binding protein
MKSMSKFQFLFGLLAILGLVLSACGQKSTPAAQPAGQSDQSAQTDLKGNISVSGAFALYPMMTRWAEEFQKFHPGVTFDVSAGGAGKGMADALAGAVDIGMVSRAVTPEEEAKGAYWAPVVKDAVFPMINAQNPVLQDLLAKGLTKEKLIGIFITGDIETWGQAVDRPEITDEIHVYTRADSCGAAEVWAKFLGDKKQENLLGVGVQADPGLLDAVIKDPLGIGYNNLGYAFDSVTDQAVAGSVALPIDKDGNGQVSADELADSKTKAIELVATGKYPSPPARALNLVTKDKPSGAVQAFIVWTLTEGQKYVGEAGYIQLPQDQIDAALQKVR